MTARFLSPAACCGALRWAGMLALGLAVAAGCRGSSSPPSAGPPPAGGPARRYTVRGEVVRLPDPSLATGDLLVRHEAIDEFADESGKVVGMDSMVMPFGVLPSISLADIRIGDKVELVLMVDWSHPSYQIEQLRKLPRDTLLTFGKARPKPAAVP